jgi:hypothetical protein
MSAVKLLPYDGRKAAAAGVADGALAGTIDGIRVGAVIEQQPHQRLVAHVGRRGERRKPAAPG